MAFINNLLATFKYLNIFNIMSSHFHINLLLLILAFFTFGPATGDSESSYPYILKEYDMRDPLQFLPVDIEDDGNDEILWVQKDAQDNYSMRLFRTLQPTICLDQENYQETRFLDSPIAFRNYAGELNIALTTSDGKNAYLYVYLISFCCKTIYVSL